MPAVSRFLLVSARPERAARDQELVSMRRASGLGERLETLPADQADLPARLFQRYAGIVTGGSPFSVTDEVKGAPQQRTERTFAELAQRALDADAPVLFTCFGIGVLTRVLGGTVDRTHPEPVSAAVSHLTDAGVVDDVARVLPASFTALTGHKESAPDPPPGSVLLATNDASPVQLYRAGSVLASQFHPEPTVAEFVERATIYAGYGYFPPDELPGIAERLHASSVSEPRRLLRRFAEVHG